MANICYYIYLYMCVYLIQSNNIISIYLHNYEIFCINLNNYHFYLPHSGFLDLRL